MGLDTFAVTKKAVELQFLKWNWQKGSKHKQATSKRRKKGICDFYYLFKLGTFTKDYGINCCIIILWRIYFRTPV